MPGETMLKAIKLVLMIAWVFGCSSGDGGDNEAGAIDTSTDTAGVDTVGRDTIDDGSIVFVTGNTAENNSDDNIEQVEVPVEDADVVSPAVVAEIEPVNNNSDVVEITSADGNSAEGNNNFDNNNTGNEIALSNTVSPEPVSLTPNGLRFKTDTLQRLGMRGDNWCQTWAADGSVITAMDDGDWFNDRFRYHSHLYKLEGESGAFSVSDIENYPDFDIQGDGWFAYGMLSVNGILYSLVSKTQSLNWSNGPFRGMKMLRSADGGSTWHRVDRNNNERFLDRTDIARELLNTDEMFFFEENGRNGKGRQAWPFSYASFVQSGRDHSASRDGYVYVYSPEGANSHQLQLARVPADLLGQRSAWEYFSGWNGNTPTWSNNIEQRQPNLVYPERASNGDYFGWYSWLPSVVWNEGLGVYIMASGGTYAGNGRTNSAGDYYSSWMHSKSGSLGLWYSENPYGPWMQFYYNEDWTVDDSKNLTYQPKLSPKWISADGRTMTLIWSDAMRDAEGNSHTVNYKWNQMEIEITTAQ